MWQRRLLYLLTFSCLSTYSQEISILHGEIQGDSIQSTSINIVNLTQAKGTINAPNGTFEIAVRENDTLVFSSVQYEYLELIVTSEIINKGQVKIQLEHMINVLDEVHLSNTDLSGNLKSDIKDFSNFDQSKVGFPLKYRPSKTPWERNYNAVSSSPWSLLNGQKRRLKRAKKIMEHDRLIDRGLSILPKSFFTKDLQIPEKDIILFVDFCIKQGNFDAVLELTSLEVMEYYADQAPGFLLGEELRKQLQLLDGFQITVWPL